MVWDFQKSDHSLPEKPYYFQNLLVEFVQSLIPSDITSSMKYLSLKPRSNLHNY